MERNKQNNYYLKIISLNSSNQNFPIAITVNNETITNRSDIAYDFNDCFAKVGIVIESSIRFSKKRYFDCPPPLNIESLFISTPGSTKFPTFSLPST